MKILFFAGCLLVMAGCLSTAQQQTATEAAGVVSSVAPLLPPPFGLIAGGLAAALTSVASISANRASNIAFKKKESPGLLVKMMTDHSSLLLVGTTLLPILRAVGLIHISDAELALVMTTLSAPVTTKKIMRRKPPGP